jgi:hypothetical protein
MSKKTYRGRTIGFLQRIVKIIFGEKSNIIFVRSIFDSMSENDGKKDISAEPREEVSGTAGLERTVGTTSASTETVERIGVAPAMPDTGSLHQFSSYRFYS